MCAIIALVVLLCIVRFSEPYSVLVDDPGAYHYEKQQDNEGNYNYEIRVYDSNLANNKPIQYRQEKGTAAKSKSGQDYIAVSGEYFHRDDQYVYRVTYTADENGYRARVRKEPIGPAGVVPTSPKPPLVQPTAGYSYPTPSPVFIVYPTTSAPEELPPLIPARAFSPGQAANIRTDAIRSLQQPG